MSRISIVDDVMFSHSSPMVCHVCC